MQVTALIEDIKPDNSDLYSEKGYQSTFNGTMITYSLTPE